MRILKQIYSDILKDIFKLIIIFIFLKKFKNDKKNNLVLINNQYHEDFSWINYIIGNILKTKGFGVKFIVCGGNNYCERMTHTIQKPNCRICHIGNVLKLKSFNHDYILQNKKKNKNNLLKSYISIKKFFKKLVINNVNFSLDFKTSFLHYFKGMVTDNINCSVVNKMYSTLVNTVFSIKKIIKNQKPIKIVTINGKNIQTGILYNLSKKNKIDCYTWDVFQQGFNGILSKNSIAHEQHISKKTWDIEKIKKIKKSDQKIIKNYMHSQSNSLNTPYKYYDNNIINQKNKIFRYLNLDMEKKIISIFPNTDWDSSTIGLDDAYDDQYHFIHEMIKFSKNNQDYNVIIRCHPGEQKVGYHLRSTRPLNQYIKEEFKNDMHSNLKIVDALSNISSYALAQLSDHRIVYTSTLGLEFSYMGLKTLVAGNAYYKYKGFTCDIKTHNSLLKYFKNNYNKNLSKKEFFLLEKFIFLSKFKRLFKLDYFINHKFYPSLKEIKKMNENQLYNNIVNFILDKRSYLNLSK